MIGHVLGDFTLQGTYIAVAKNRHNASETTPESPKTLWIYCLSAHALIHGGLVWMITGNAALGFAEVVAHWIIDAFKCEQFTNFHVDQLLHMLTKIVFVILIATGAAG